MTSGIDIGVRGIEILRKNGPMKLSKSAYRKILPFETRVRIKTNRYRLNGHPGIGSPLDLLHVPTERITHRIAARQLDEPFPKEITIRGGDWDLKARPFEGSSKYQYITEYHERDTISTRTEIVPEWKKSEEYLAEFEQLYESIRKQGYQKQSELSNGKDVSEEINICIGRDGTLIVKHGYHRTSIAKALGLDEVPVYVRVRHRDWQRRRDEAWKADSIDELSEKVRPYLSHPDIRAAFNHQQ